MGVFNCLVLISILLLITFPIDVNASSYNVKKEYVLNANIDDILNIVRDYRQYPKLFDNIKNVNIVQDNDFKDIVQFDIKILRRNFGALLRFKEYQNYGRTSYRIECDSIELKNIEILYGNFYINRITDNKTKIRIQANVKPSSILPDFMLGNIMNRSIDEAVKNLEDIAINKN